MDWFLYDRDLRHERVKEIRNIQENFKTAWKQPSTQSSSQNKNFVNTCKKLLKIRY